MSKFDPASTSLRTAISLALVSAGSMLPVHMAVAQDNAAQESQELEEVVVTGFRGSLNTALAQKRSETAAVDVIDRRATSKVARRAPIGLCNDIARLLLPSHLGRVYARWGPETD